MSRLLSLRQVKKGSSVNGVVAQVYATKYLARAAASAPRDFANAYLARFKPIHPTVLIFHCTFVCDARCEMCNNWKRGDRKSDMSLEEIEENRLLKKSVTGFDSEAGT